MNGQYNFLSLVPIYEKPVAPPMALVEKVHFSFDQWLKRIQQGEGYNWLNEFSIESQRVIYLDRCWLDEIRWKEWCNACEETNKG